MELKVLSINTWKGDGDYPKRMALLSAQLKEITPDIILVQEAFKTKDGAFDTMQTIALQLDYHYSFLPARKKIRRIGGFEKMSYSGVGCWSKSPISYVEAIDLPSNDQDGGRVGQIIKIKIQQSVFLFGNLHLSFLKDSDELKIQQLEYFLERFATIPNVDYYLLGGDFNSTPDSETIQYLLNHPQFKVQDTHAKLNQPTMPIKQAGHIGRRIDYLFSLCLTGRSFLPIMHTQISLNTTDEAGILPSDHFGVTTHFRFP